MSATGAERLARARLVMLRVGELDREADALRAEAERCHDVDGMANLARRMAAIRAEMGVLHASMVEVRREQLLEQAGADPPEPEPRRRWWQRLLSP